MNYSTMTPTIKQKAGGKTTFKKQKLMNHITNLNGKKIKKTNKMKRRKTGKEKSMKHSFIVTIG